MSHHTYLTCARYHLENFPKADSLLIAPPEGWTLDQGGTLFRPEKDEIRPNHSKGRVSIPAYDTPGFLLLNIGHRVHTLGSVSQAQTAHVVVDMREDPFSREDITALMTSLCKGMGGQFIPAQIGLYNVTAYQLTTRQHAISNPWFFINSVTFQDHVLDTQLTWPNETIDSGAFRFYLHNRLKYDYLPDAEGFRIRDIA